MRRVLFQEYYADSEMRSICPRRIPLQKSASELTQMKSFYSEDAVGTAFSIRVHSLFL